MPTDTIQLIFVGIASLIDTYNIIQDHDSLNPVSSCTDPPMSFMTPQSWGAQDQEHVTSSSSGDRWPKLDRFWLSQVWHPNWCLARRIGMTPLTVPPPNCRTETVLRCIDRDISPTWINMWSLCWCYCYFGLSTTSHIRKDFFHPLEHIPHIPPIGGKAMESLSKSFTLALPVRPQAMRVFIVFFLWIVF